MTPSRFDALISRKWWFDSPRSMRPKRRSPSASEARNCCQRCASGSRRRFDRQHATAMAGPSRTSSAPAPMPMRRWSGREWRGPTPAISPTRRFGRWKSSHDAKIGIVGRRPSCTPVGVAEVWCEGRRDSQAGTCGAGSKPPPGGVDAEKRSVNSSRPLHQRKIEEVVRRPRRNRQETERLATNGDLSGSRVQKLTSSLFGRPRKKGACRCLICLVCRIAFEHGRFQHRHA